MSASTGSAHHASKITEEQVREIKKLLQQKKLSQGQIAAQYGVDRTTICNIKKGKSWSHVEVLTECQHNGRHQHGMPTMYQWDGCRCSPCRDAHRVDMNRRRRAIAYGRHKAHQPVWPVRERLLKLRALGISDRMVSELTGVSHSAQYAIIYKMKPDGYVTFDTSKKILALPLTAGPATSTARADGTGAARRIQALIAIGWTQKELSKGIGIGQNTVTRILRMGRVEVGVSRKVAAYYDRMWDKPAPPSKARSMALHVARVHGYYPPLAWDDDEIDDPQAKPHGEWRAVA